jgi:hypothetical protein
LNRASFVWKSLCLHEPLLKIKRLVNPDESGLFALPKIAALKKANFFDANAEESSELRAGKSSISTDIRNFAPDFESLFLFLDKAENSGSSFAHLSLVISLRLISGLLSAE